MTDEKRDSVLAAIMRKIGELATSIDHNTAALERFARAEKAVIQEKAPEQPPLPGMPPDDWTPPEIEAKKPREWCNTVKVWEILFDKLGCSHTTIEDVLCDRELWTKIAVFTKHKVHAGSFSRILSTLDRAGAATRVRGRLFSVIEPTDELRESVERTAKKRAAAKEVSA